MIGDNSPEPGHVVLTVADEAAGLPAVLAGGGAQAELLVVAGEPGPVETEIFISMEDKGRRGSRANPNRCHDNRYQAQYS